jgi:hypothetical protein
MLARRPILNRSARPPAPPARPPRNPIRASNVRRPMAARGTATVHPLFHIGAWEPVADARGDTPASPPRRRAATVRASAWSGRPGTIGATPHAGPRRGGRAASLVGRACASRKGRAPDAVRQPRRAESVSRVGVSGHAHDQVAGGHGSPEAGGIPTRKTPSVGGRAGSGLRKGGSPSDRRSLRPPSATAPAGASPGTWPAGNTRATRGRQTVRGRARPGLTAARTLPMKLHPAAESRAAWGT